MADNQGVTGTDSPTEGTVANQADVTSASSPEQAVTAGSAPVADRPEENWQREFQRKVDQQQKQLDQVLAYLVSGQQQRQAPQGTSTEPPTDEELWGLAQQGDRAAFDEYMARKARRELAQNQAVGRKQQIIQGQLQAIVGKYPVLNNPQHPLAQTMNQAYQLLLQNGYTAGPETLLEAAKTAIADRPDLVAEHYSQGAQAREQSRQDGTRRAQSGSMGATYRQDARPNSQPKVTSDEAALAARMGIKDPAKAMERFRERQKQGRSSFGAVAAFIPEEGQ